MNAESSARDSEVNPIVSASDRDPFASDPGPSTFVSRALSPRVSFPGLKTGLSPHAHSRGRAPQPSGGTLNCARFAASSGNGETKKIISSRQQAPLFFRCLYFHISSWRYCCNLFRAATSACRLASMSLRSLGLAVATAFLLSTTSLGGSPLASSTPSAVSRWDTSTVLQRKQQLCNT